MTANPDPTKPPAEYQFPALNWFRGVQMELMADNGLLAIHGEVIMPVETKPAPAFQLPKLPFGLGGGNDKAKPAAKTRPSRPRTRPKPTQRECSRRARGDPPREPGHPMKPCHLPLPIIVPSLLAIISPRFNSPPAPRNRSTWC